MKSITIAMLGMVTALILIGPARAERIDMRSSDGPMRVEISRNGEVDGAYPDRDGVMRGHINAAGEVSGIWLQPRSDHLCRDAKGGTRAWGTFRIGGIHTTRPVGMWGYCNEHPTRDWRLRRQ